MRHNYLRMINRFKFAPCRLLTLNDGAFLNKCERGLPLFLMLEPYKRSCFIWCRLASPYYLNVRSLKAKAAHSVGFFSMGR